MPRSGESGVWFEGNGYAAGFLAEIVAFSKFDPHKEQVVKDEVAERRAWLLKVGTTVSFIFTMVGFIFIGIILFRGRLY